MRGVGVCAAPDQRGKHVHHDVAFAVGGDARLTRLRQQRFGFLLFDLAVETVRHPPLGERHRAGAVVFGLRCDVGEFVGAVEIDIGLHDGAGDGEARRIVIEARCVLHRFRLVERCRLLAPEVDAPGQIAFDGAEPAERAAIGRRNDVVVAEAGVFVLRVERHVRIELRSWLLPSPPSPRAIAPALRRAWDCARAHRPSAGRGSGSPSPVHHPVSILGAGSVPSPSVLSGICVCCGTMPPGTQAASKVTSGRAAKARFITPALLRASPTPCRPPSMQLLAGSAIASRAARLLGKSPLKGHYKN